MKINYRFKIGATILRFLLGFFLFKDFIIFTTNKKYLFNSSGIVSYETYQDIINYYNLHLFNINFNYELNISIFLFLGIIFSFLFLLGFLQQISALIIFILLFIFKIRNIYLLDGADNVISVILPFYFFINTYSFSKKYDQIIDGLLNRFKLSKFARIISFYGAIGIMIQISIIYFFAGLHKLDGETWRNGTALYYILNSNDFSPSLLNAYISRSLVLIKFLSWFTIFFQLSFPILIWFKKFKKIYIILGIFLHLGIFILMKIDNFSFVLISCYAIFFNNKFYRRFRKYGMR